MLKKILIGVDGGGHTRKAIEYALTLSEKMSVQLTALHVKDPYLKQFYTEIYAQGRKEYLDHVEKEIQEQSQQALDQIKELAGQGNIDLTPLSRNGDPVEEFLDEANQGGYGMAVVGAKSLNIKNRLRSRNLPEKILKKITIPLLIVRESRVTS